MVKVPLNQNECGQGNVYYRMMIGKMMPIEVTQHNLSGPHNSGFPKIILCTEGGSAEAQETTSSTAPPHECQQERIPASAINSSPSGHKTHEVERWVSKSEP